MPLERLIEEIAAFDACGARIRDWSVHGVETRRLSLGIQDRRTGGPHTPLDLTEAFGARFLLVWSDGRVSAGELDRSEIEAGAGAALGRARAAAYDDPDAAWVLGPAAMPDVRIHDPDTERIASGDTAPIAARLARIREHAASRGFRTWSGSFGASLARSRVVTSLGLDAEAAGTSWAWRVVVDGEIGDGFRGRAEEPWDEFDARVQRLAELAAALRRPAGRAVSGVCPVVLHPDVVETLVLDALLDNLGGAAVAHGESPFRREQFGTREPVLREDLSLRLDPLEPLRAGSYRFTREGVPAAPCVFVERGCLVTPVLSLKYARRLGRTPTAVPQAHDTLHLEGPEPLPLAEALEEADGGALVLRVLGAHTQDATSGDFSLSAPQTLTVEGGRPGGRVRATLAGNLLDALRDGGLRLVRFEGCVTPGILLRCRLSSS